ncbi:GNAT family N-acetyltransferase [Staphylococcus xylosus]|uniref:GNAT family N-acetyltransferase n=1 Tax=Staphylococcus xylosus TaxID=1288 RepID=UPI001C3EFDC7|nr:GNAT family protein [Staphylococcus xylosus]MCI8279781.1 GNAT family N-acetyltransferase [Staphylococcus xylosus]
MIQFSKGTLEALNGKIIDDWYYWKYEELEKKAKKWNAPYIREPAIDKVSFTKELEVNRYIYPNVESTLAIMVDNNFIGTVGSYWIDKNTNWLEIGIVIYNSDYWESGIGTEVFQLWIDYLFKKDFVHRLGISTWSGNERMIKLAQKVGMREEARIRQARSVNGQYFDAIKMGILKCEWRNV